MSTYTYDDIRRGLLNEKFIYFKILSKIFAAPVAYLAYLLGITPNQVTLLGILLSLPAVYLNLTGHLIAGIVLFHLFFILDTTDGVLARGTDSRSMLGAYMDDLAHYIFHTTFYVSFSYGLFKAHEDTLALTIALFILVNTITRAHLDLVEKTRLKNNLGGKVNPSVEANGSLAQIKGIFLRSFEFPNVLVWTSLLFFNKGWLNIYFDYSLCLASLYLLYTISKTIKSKFNA